MISTGITPADLGLPPKFSHWRPRQEEIVMEQADTECRFLIQCAGTGSGKSPSYVAGANITGQRTCILTHTKGLQTQNMDDFESCGMVDMRGKSNYSCEQYPKLNCEQAWPKCNLHNPKPTESGTGCTYQKQLVRARKSNLVQANYSMWMAINSFGEGLGEFDRLVLDEAHEAPELISSFLSIDLTTRELLEDLKCSQYPHTESPISEWATFARELLKQAAIYVEDISGMIKQGDADDDDLKHLAKYRELVRKLTTMSTMHVDNWIADTTKVGFRFDPIWPANYAESILFRGIPHILCTSATVRPKTAELLNIDLRNPTVSKFSEYPSSFSPLRSPLYQLSTSPNMSYGSGLKDVNNNRFWMSDIDRIIARRMDRKGIANTITFDLLKYMIANSEYRHIMASNDTIYAGGDRRTMEVIQNFKQSAPPTLLCSPSISTGFDFAGSSCEYQIIAKLPYPPANTRVAKARKERDKEYYEYQAANALVQICGRGMRRSDDQCENFIIDSRASGFMYRNRHLFPRDFSARFKKIVSLPEPPKRLE